MGVSPHSTGVSFHRSEVKPSCSSLRAVGFIEPMVLQSPGHFEYAQHDTTHTTHGTTHDTHDMGDHGGRGHECTDETALVTSGIHDV